LNSISECACSRLWPLHFLAHTGGSLWIVNKMVSFQERREYCWPVRYLWRSLVLQDMISCSLEDIDGTYGDTHCLHIHQALVLRLMCVLENVGVNQYKRKFKKNDITIKKAT
jgi:hypothetical protein